MHLQVNVCGFFFSSATVLSAVKYTQICYTSVLCVKVLLCHYACCFLCLRVRAGVFAREYV